MNDLTQNFQISPALVSGGDEELNSPSVNGASPLGNRNGTTSAMDAPKEMVI